MAETGSITRANLECFGIGTLYGFERYRGDH